MYASKVTSCVASPMLSYPNLQGQQYNNYSSGVKVDGQCCSSMSSKTSEILSMYHIIHKHYLRQILWMLQSNFCITSTNVSMYLTIANLAIFLCTTSDGSSYCKSSVCVTHPSRSTYAQILLTIITVYCTSTSSTTHTPTSSVEAEQHLLANSRPHQFDEGNKNVLVESLEKCS